jgi:glycosyltransferase involved in cell wall biosynthesis
LSQVLAALRAQTLPIEQWELILVDDASREPLAATVDVSWHPGGRVIETDVARRGIGLVGARLKGFEAGFGDIFVFVDQDNVLRGDFLMEVVEIGRAHPWLGAWGGQITLKFDEPASAPEPWLRPILCTRHVEHDTWSNDVHHHASTPWGAGLCVRREVMQIYRDKVEANPLRRLLDPTSSRMGFGGDTDLAYVGCRAGYGKGVFVRLQLDHLTPAGRCTDEYLLKHTEAKGYSEVLHEFIEEGAIRRPRRDLRFWIMTFLRWPRMRRLEGKLLLRFRRGQSKAFRELSEKNACLPK